MDFVAAALLLRMRRSAAAAAEIGGLRWGDPRKTPSSCSVGSTPTSYVREVYMAHERVMPPPTPSRWFWRDSETIDVCLCLCLFVFFSALSRRRVSIDWDVQVKMRNNGDTEADDEFRICCWNMN